MPTKRAGWHDDTNHGAHSLANPRRLLPRRSVHMCSSPWLSLLLECAQTPDGQSMQVQVPAGVGPGMAFMVQTPAPATAPHMSMPQVVQPVMQQQQVVAAFQQPIGQQGTDYRVLAQFGDLFVKQQVEMLEVFTGFEGQNKYDIFGTLLGMGQQHIFHAAEQSECLQRQCFKQMRAFEMNVFNNPAAPLIHIQRPLKCCSCVPVDGCLQELHVFANGPQGQQIGIIREVWTCSAQEFDLVVPPPTPHSLVHGPLRIHE